MRKKMPTDWKDHPVLIAAGSAAATAVLFITVASPIIEKSNVNQINELKTTSENFKSLSKEQEEKLKNAKETHIKKEIELNQTITTLKAEVTQYKNEDRYSTDNPLPKGLRKISLFDNYEKIATEHPENKFNENTLFQKIDLEDSFFSSVVYYPLECGNTKIVREIRFIYKSLIQEYAEKIAAKVFSYGVNPVPSDKDIEDSRAEKKSALITIFRQKYGQERNITEDGDYIFVTPDKLMAVGDLTLYVMSIYEDEKIKQLCEDGLICPQQETSPDTNKPNSSPASPL